MFKSSLVFEETKFGYNVFCHLKIYPNVPRKKNCSFFFFFLRHAQIFIRFWNGFCILSQDWSYLQSDTLALKVHNANKLIRPPPRQFSHINLSNTHFSTVLMDTVAIHMKTNYSNLIQDVQKEVTLLTKVCLSRWYFESCCREVS